MNDQVNDFEALERRLRDHYRRQLDPVDHPAVLWSGVRRRIGGANSKAVAAPGSANKSRSAVGRAAFALGGLSLVVLLGLFGLGLVLPQSATHLQGAATATDAEPPALLFADALDGAVISRSTGDQQGLFVFGKTGWTKLDGSDADSRIETRCDGGDLVYDVPNPGVVAPTPVTVIASGSTEAKTYYNGEWLATRHLARSEPTGKLRQELAFELNSEKFYECSAIGVVSMRVLNSMPVPISSQPTNISTEYQPLGSKSLIVPQLPGSNWYIMSVSEVDGSILLVEQVGSEKDWRIRIYRADADGVNLRLLDERTDIPYMGTTTISPDGKNALMMFIDPKPTPQVFKSVLYDLDGNRTPQVLAESVTIDNDSSLDIFARFITSGSMRDQLLLVKQDKDGQQVKIYDPDDVNTPLFNTLLARGTGLMTSVTSDQLNSDFTLWSWDDPATKILYNDESGKRHIADVPLDENQLILAGRMLAGYLIYQTSPRSSLGGAGRTDKLYSLALASIDDPSVAPVKLVESTSSPTLQRKPSNFWLGSRRMAYVTPEGNLRIKNYDGTDDVLVETGVSGFSNEFGYLRR